MWLLFECNARRETRPCNGFWSNALRTVSPPNEFNNLSGRNYVGVLEVGGPVVWDSCPRCRTIAKRFAKRVQIMVCWCMINAGYWSLAIRDSRLGRRERAGPQEEWKTNCDVRETIKSLLRVHVKRFLENK